MRRTNKIIMAAVIVAVLLLGIGYAAVQNITLNITGTAAADPSQSNFKVMFSGTPTVSDETYVTAAVTDDTNATINVEGLTKKGDVVTATYTVQNASTDLSADLSVTTTNSNIEYFTLSSELDKTSLIAGEATTLTVTVELTKTPITESVSATIGVQLTAMPVQPGEEGTSEGINGSSQTPWLNPDDGTTPVDGATYVSTDSAYNDYTYTYSEANGGWKVVINDKTKASYDSIFESINGEPVNSLSSTFSNCTSLVTAPAIPNGVTNMYNTFLGCTSLTTAPEIPDGVTKMSSTFYGCKSLITAPVMPTNVIYVDNTFNGCKALTNAPDLSKCTKLTNMPSTFQGCTSLTNVPAIPDGVSDLSGAFQGCTSLTIAPTIPDSVTKISYTFQGCTSLESITFEGTVAQWNAITFGQFWKDGVIATEVVCSDGTVSI